MKQTDLKIIKNSVLWGGILWLLGYILGILLFFVVPKDQIGYYILPIGVLLTLIILFKKVRRNSLVEYLKVGIVWSIMAIILDYFFIVLLFKSTDYYKLDVYLYYVVTFLLPVIFYCLIKDKKLSGLL